MRDRFERARGCGFGKGRSSVRLTTSVSTCDTSWACCIGAPYYVDGICRGMRLGTFNELSSG
jgi:hypothetical protein